VAFRTFKLGKSNLHDFNSCSPYKTAQAMKVNGCAWPTLAFLLKQKLNKSTLWTVFCQIYQIRHAYNMRPIVASHFFINFQFSNYTKKYPILLQ